MAPSPARLVFLGQEPQVGLCVDRSDTNDNKRLYRCVGVAHFPPSGHNREATDEQ